MKKPPTRCELCDLRREELWREEEIRRLEQGIKDIEQGIKTVKKALHELSSCR